MEELWAWWWALWGIEQASSKKRKRKSYPTTRPKPKRR